MADTLLKGFPDSWGQHQATLIDHVGPTSYVQGGEKITAAQGLWPRSFAWVGSALTYSGTYRVDCIYPGTGLRSWVYFKWTNASTGQEVGNGVSLSGEKVRLLVVGG